MSEFQVHTKQSAPEQSREIMEGAEKKYGFLPNLLGVLAESPVALEAYTSLSAMLEKGTLSAAERALVLLAVSRTNECHYCVAAHSGIALQSGLSEGTVEALREGEELDDPKLEALRRFTVSMVEERGFLDPEELRTFLDAGYTKEQALEVITAVAMKTVSNYTNHLAETPVDEPFAEHTWDPEAETVEVRRR